MEANAPQRQNLTESSRSVESYRSSGFHSLVLSFCFHAILCLAFARFVSPTMRGIYWYRPAAQSSISVVLSNVEPETIESVVDVEIVAPDGLPLVAKIPELAMAEDSPDIAATELGVLSNTGEGEVVEKSKAPAEPLFNMLERPRGGGYEGRLNEAGRAKLLGSRGGTPESEQGVSRALEWIVAHQNTNGSWQLDHRNGPCGGRCRNPGTGHTVNGATALALLPLLGAGHTTERGGYQEQVRRGMAYLRQQAKPSPHGIDLHEGNMYAQGLAAIVFCEAYAMTRDESLRADAQGTIDFIVHAQHAAGGWRYFPKQAGDTTVFGWQYMALESARRAGLEVPHKTFSLANEFLNSTQSEDGSAYGYQLPGESPSPTAIGLLCRMYAGRARADERLTRGVERLRAWGPSPNDMYFNFYATQVMSNFGGHEWVEWNTQTREHLLATQAQHGHEFGSWHFSHEHALTGGRLYNTALATLMLEVYYRHLPLFNEPSPQVAKRD